MTDKQRSNSVYRIAVGVLFFLQGICFATWASRIPSIQQQLHISETLLGVVLFALPVGSMISLTFSSFLVSTYGSKKIATIALTVYGLALPIIGLASNVLVLASSLVFFGMAGNLSNIAINTQAVLVEAKYGRSIMASFHGLWSLAGFTAAGIGTYMIAKSILPLTHFLFIMAIIVVALAVCVRYLVADNGTSATGSKLFVRPDKSLLKLGVIAFCCMICEGAMFDWSGIYFKKVVHAEEGWIGAGYTSFMCAMASGRFIADWVTNRLKFQNTILLSGTLITAGLSIAIAFPFIVPSIIGFLIVGFGVSSVVPLVYSQAGKSKTIAPGAALTAVSSIGFLGFLIGPPTIGVIAGVFSLRVSFCVIAIIGVAVVFLAKKSSDE